MTTKDTYRRIVLTTAALALAGALASGDAATTDPPAADVIGPEINAALPAYWTVQSLQLTGPVDYGNAIEPDWRWRFEAVLTPKEPLYVEAGAVDGVVLLKPTLTAESQETQYGTVRATFHAGRWNTEVSAENRPFDGRGLPGSFYAGRTVVEGSEEEQALRDNAHERFVERLKDQHARQRAATEQQHKTELAGLESQHEATVAALKMNLAAEAQQQAEEVAAAETRHKSELDEAEAAHRRSLAEAAAAHRQALATLEQQHASALEAVKTKLAADAALRREEFAADEALRAIDRQGMRQAITSAEQVTALATQTDAAMAALEAQLETLAAAEAATLAATAQVVKGREEALQTLLGELDAAGTDERYRIVLDSVSETDAPWLLESALRHGLRAEDPAMRRHAWLRLLQSEFIDTPNGQTVLAEHVHTLEHEPVLLTFLVGKLAPKMAQKPDLLRMLTANLPSVDQWATRLVSYSSQWYAATNVLGAADVKKRCDAGAYNQSWVVTKDFSGTQSIQVGFDAPVLIPRVSVHEEHGTGFVRKLVLWSPEGQATEYTVDDPAIGLCGVAQFRLYEHPAPVLEVTVVIERSDEYLAEAIDAISLSGVPITTRIADRES